MSRKNPQTQVMQHLVPSQIIRRRSWMGAAVLCVVFLVIVMQLFNVQYINAAKLQAQANRQSTITETLLAMRGSIVDRNGEVLATTENARSLTFQPVIVRKQLEQAHAQSNTAPETESYLNAMATAINQYFPKVPVDQLLAKMNSTEPFVYLVRNVSPTIANNLQSRFPQIGAERTPVRVYPARSVAGNLIGITRSDGPGLEGLELTYDAVLAGTNGSRTYDQGEDGTFIPGSERDYYRQKDGDKIVLTIDADLQNFVQSKLDDAVRVTGAHSAEAVVLAAKTGQVLAMANNNTFDPAQGPSGLDSRSMLNPSVEGAFEPGSVNKVIAASGLMQYHLARPTEVLNVPGQIHMGSAIVHDAWVHSTEPLTVQGVFGKSSNVGTLMLSQRIGPQRYYDLARKFGLGQLTGIGLEGESAGYIPPMSQWSGSTFANLPIGQGLSMTLLQMTALYQTIANNGVRIPPRIIKAEVNSDNKIIEEPAPASIRVISPAAAHQVLRMFEGTVQSDPSGLQRGTGSKAAITGYQISGKTGTAQQVDPRTHAYSNSAYNITFAGIAPADDPQFVIGIFLNNPHLAPDGSRALTAAPLFRTIAQWMLNRYQIPLSKKPAPRLILQPGW